MTLFLWSLALLVLWLSTFLALRKGRRRRSLSYPPVSILKPLKGMDAGLSRNLESFFLLDYPRYELIFSVADPLDPAIAVVRRLQDKYPGVRARLVLGAEEYGWNPKVNNMIRSYEAAEFEWILISDSNVKVGCDYLRDMVEELTPGVGVVTAVVAGTAPRGLGGRLESIYLNSFYARGLNLAFSCGRPCVIGKSMLFSRAMLDGCGGMRALSGYVAEDFMIGELAAGAGCR